jgi:hypothetical protein
MGPEKSRTVGFFHTPFLTFLDQILTPKTDFLKIIVSTVLQYHLSSGAGKFIATQFSR